MAGHVAPEAAHGGPIAALREGDIVRFDIPARTLSVDLSDEELAARMSALDARAAARCPPASWANTPGSSRPRHGER